MSLNSGLDFNKHVSKGWNERNKIMDIYNFINSGDVAAHCRRINKTWSPFEMAVIIGRSQCSLSEKLEAWRELVSDYPDMPIPKNMHCDGYESLHRELSITIDYWETAITLFKKQEQDAVYMHKVYWYKECRYSDEVFRTYEMALSDAQNSWDLTEASEIIIKKYYFDDEGIGKGGLEAWLDYDGIIYDISPYGSEAAHQMWFPNLASYKWERTALFADVFYVDIPVPFKRGDILTYSTDIRTTKGKDIFILDWLVSFEPERHAKYLSGEFGDGSDIIGWGLYVGENGILYGDHTGSYDHFEYYRGELEGKEQLLHYVNLFINDEIQLPELLTMHCRIALELKLKEELRIDTHGCYISERHLAENRISKEENEQSTDLMPWIEGKLSIHQVEFLVSEFGGNTETVQIGLSDGGGWYMGGCAGIVHDEDYYAKTNDTKFNSARMAMARMVLEAYGMTENGWINKHAELITPDV